MPGGGRETVASEGDESVTVVHVDDDAEFVDLAATLLERAGDALTVEPVTTTEDALARLEEGGIDCVVSDYEMPDSNGIEFLRTVRSKYGDLPFILFTSKGSEEVASEAISAGVTDYLQKSIGGDNYPLLANRIENAVQAHRTRTRAARRERINELIRTINARLVAADDRTEIEQAVCDALSDSNQYRFAWIGVPNGDGEIVPRASGGDAEDYLDRIVARHDDTATGHGPGGRAVRTREPQLVQDMQSDPAMAPWRPDAVDAGFGSVFVLPLESDAGFYGILAVYAAESEAFTEAEQAVLGELASTIAAAIDAAEAEQRLVEREQELRESRAKITSLHEVARELSDCHTVEAVCEATANAAAEVLAFDMCVVTIERDGDLVVEAGKGIPPDGSTRMPVEEGVAGKTFRTGESYRIDDLNEVPAASPQDDSYRSAISAPIGDHGVFQAVAEETGAFSTDDVELTELLLSHTTAALTRVADRRRLRQREQQLEAQLDRLDGLTSIVGQDLRDPLDGLAGALRQAESTGNPEAFDRCRRAIDRIDDVLDDLLTLTRVDESAPSRHPVDIGRVTRDCWAGLDTEDATLRIDGSGAVRADLGSFRRLIENLLTNALQHGPADVTVSVGTLDDDAGFHVTDDGPGVQTDDPDRLFDAGYSTTDTGTGFGLTIVERVANAHDWSVRVEEGPDGGARFEIHTVTEVTDTETPRIRDPSVHAVD